ncbi:MAG TPA: hypothetical protein VIH59_06440 [Candidatus Tectomicrobia bacterium]
MYTVRELAPASFAGPCTTQVAVGNLADAIVLVAQALGVGWLPAPGWALAIGV